MVFVGDAKVTRFSFIEYQALILTLACGIVALLVALEVAIRRFQLLPLLYPGMFSVRDRRFYVFDLDISDGPLGKRIRKEAKMLMRMTMCLVLSYLWQHCVMDTYQSYSTQFPREQCDIGFDCFASELHFMTFFNRQFQAIDCGLNRTSFDGMVVVSCIRFIPPSATEWMKQLAISHSVTQLHLKTYEISVWAAGKSTRLRMFLASWVGTTAIIFFVLFFMGLLSTFMNSWLSFVMSLSAPYFLYSVWQFGAVLEGMWKEQAYVKQQRVESDIDLALVDIEGLFLEESQDPILQETSGHEDSGEDCTPVRFSVSSFLKSHLPASLKNI